MSVAVPIVVSNTAGPASASAALQDRIVYYQQKTGSGGSYLEYLGSNGTVLKQTVSFTATSGDGDNDADDCLTPTVSNPVLAFGASYYPKGYGTTPVAASVGAYDLHTGVCAVQQDSAIEVKEGLIFGISQTNSLTKRRLFSEATIPLVRNDKTSGTLSGNLVLRLTENGVETQVGTVPFTIKGACGTVVDIDTGFVKTGFDQLEIQVDSPSAASVSVVGPTTVNGSTVVPTFYLGSAPAITSANNTTFTVGGSGSFKVTTTGNPTPTLSDANFSGCVTTLPADVTFTDNGDGTATIGGMPAASTGGTYTVCINAANGVGTPATQIFTLTVDQAPAITSAANTSFVVGTPGTFTVTTTGNPTPTLTDSDFGGCTTTLPALVTFTDNGDGTATIGGTPAASTGGTYTVCVNASNGVGTPATQVFALTVQQPPAITSAASTTFNAGLAGSFTVTTSGYPTPTLTDADFTGCTTTLPDHVSFTDNGDGTATIGGTPAATTGGTYTICINASNGVGTTATQTFTLTVNAEVCSGNSVDATQAPGTDVSASISVASGCKNYTEFLTSGPTETSGDKSVSFGTTGTQSFTATSTLDWGLVPYCVPNSSGGGSGPPVCAPTEVSLDGGVTYEPQTFCTIANPPTTPAWCTTNVQYTYVTVSGTLYTHIVEEWSGQGDPVWSR